MHLRATVSGLDEPLQRLYRDFPLLDDERVFSCHIGLEEVRAWLPRSHRRIRFTVDGRAPHEDLPVGQALAVFEWGSTS